MIRPICRDAVLLGSPCAPSSPEDAATGRDLADTLNAHAHECVGMAANMIGELKRIIAVSLGPVPLIMYDPVIRKKSGPYETEEGCLSLSGTRRTTRYRLIEVEYRDGAGKRRTGSFSGFTAQIIQHEIDHTNGILI